MRVIFADKDIKPIEDNNEGEVDEREPSCVWLEPGPEYKSVTVNTLCLQCLVELHICNTDRAPGEEGGNGGQVLEPVEGCGSPTAGIDGEIRETSNRGCDEDAPASAS